MLYLQYSELTTFEFMQKTSVNNGLFLGVALVIAIFVLYLANTRMFFNAKSFVLFTVFLLMTIKSGLDARRANGGFISFSKAFINMFVTGAIGYLLATIGEYILFNFVDPSLPELQKEIAMEAMEEMSGLFGGAEMEAAMEKEMDKLEDRDLSGPGAMMMNYITRLIAPVAIISAIVGVIIKKPGTPVDDLDDNQENRYIVNK